MDSVRSIPTWLGSVDGGVWLLLMAGLGSGALAWLDLRYYQYPNTRGLISFWSYLPYLLFYLVLGMIAFVFIGKAGDAVFKKELLDLLKDNLWLKVLVAALFAKAIWQTHIFSCVEQFGKEESANILRYFQFDKILLEKIRDAHDEAVQELCEEANNSVLEGNRYQDMKSYLENDPSRLKMLSLQGNNPTASWDKTTWINAYIAYKIIAHFPSAVKEADRAAVSNDWEQKAGIQLLQYYLMQHGPQRFRKVFKENFGGG